MPEGIVCVCSRGLIHSRTMESIQRNIHEHGWGWDIEFTHELPIPDAQNAVTEAALAREAEWLWFVEEDMQFGPDTLRRLMRLGKEADVVAADYRLRQAPHLTPRKASRSTDKGELLYAGMGCVLVRAAVFERMERPFFQAGRYSIDRRTLDAVKYPGEARYGGQDVHFFVECRKLGIRVTLADVDCQHLVVKTYGQPGRNDGCHEIAAL